MGTDDLRTLIRPQQAAQMVGVTEGMLRWLASDRYYMSFLECPRDARGFRMYTEQDITLLRYLVQAERRGTHHRELKERLHTRGVESILHDALGAEGEMAVLKARHERVLHESAVILKDRESLQKQLEEQGVILRQTQDALTRIRLAGIIVTRDTEEVARRVDASLSGLRAERQEAVDEIEAARRQLTAIRDQLASWWQRSFRGGTLAAEMNRALDRLETAQKRLSNIDAALEETREKGKELLKSLLEMRGPLALPGSAQTEEDVFAQAAAADGTGASPNPGP